MSEPTGLPGSQRPSPSTPHWGDKILSATASASEPTGLPGHHPAPPAPAQRPAPVDQPIPSPKTPHQTLREHPAYHQLSQRPALPAAKRALAWVTRVLRSDDVAARVAQAAVGAQRPVTTGRRIVVVGATGGAGATTVSVGLARTLGAIRNAPVALVAAGGSPTLEARVDVAALPARYTDAPAPDFSSQLATMTQSGQLSITRPKNDVAELARGLGRFFSVTIVDAGCHPNPQLVREAHLVLIVASADAPGEVAALNSTEPSWPASITVFVPRLPGRLGRFPRQPLRERKTPGKYIPYDRHLAAGAALHLRLAAEHTQVAFGELAAATMHPESSP